MFSYYAGVGSRQTPSPVLEFMTKIATFLSHKNYSLRSGGADGADTAFKKGAGAFCIFRPTDNIPQTAFFIAEQHHPAWDKCTDFARKCHARNAMIVLGGDLCSPVDFVIAWTPDGQASGGTGQAIRIAQHYKIPVINIKNTLYSRGVEYFHEEYIKPVYK